VRERRVFSVAGTDASVHGAGWAGNGVYLDAPRSGLFLVWACGCADCGYVAAMRVGTFMVVVLSGDGPGFVVRPTDLTVCLLCLVGEVAARSFRLYSWDR